MEWLRSNLTGVIAVGLCVLVFAVYGISVKRREKRWDDRDAPRQSPAREAEPEAPQAQQYALQKVKATVVELACGVRTVGLHTPKTITEFVVVFQSAAGQVYQFTVPEEMYEGLEKGQTGIVSFTDEDLYSFDLEETEE